MKIGIDASRLTQTKRTGTENYLYYLVKAISKSDTKNQYVLYFKEEPDPSFISELTSTIGR